MRYYILSKRKEIKIGRVKLTSCKSAFNPPVVYDMSLTMSLPLTICLWLGPPWFNYWFSFTLAYSRISHEYSSLFIIVINLIFMFSL